MWKDINEFILSCDTCLRLKNPQHWLYELLQSLPIPRQSWSFISMDFITDLLLLTLFNNIFVVIDWLTKMAYFIPCKKSITGKETTSLFIDNIYHYYKLPNDIVLDCGPQFVSRFWKALSKILKVDINIFFAFYLQTDGQMKWMNKKIKYYLRYTIKYQ